MDGEWSPRRRHITTAAIVNATAVTMLRMMIASGCPSFSPGVDCCWSVASSPEGSTVGELVGESVGTELVGKSVGSAVGSLVVGDDDGCCVVGCEVAGAAVGS